MSTKKANFEAQKIAISKEIDEWKAKYDLLIENKSKAEKEAFLAAEQKAIDLEKEFVSNFKNAEEKWQINYKTQANEKAEKIK